MESSEKRDREQLQRFAWGEFVFDAAAGELWRGTHRVRLRRQPGIVLRLLAGRAGQVVTRDELRRALWDSDVHVDYEQGINWCIRELRKALHDNAANPKFIETIAKQGYRFLPGCSAVEEEMQARSGHSLPGWKQTRVFASLAVLLVLALALAWGPHNAPTLLVLPLDNFSGDASMDNVANAGTDYLIASLGGDPAHLHVIDRPTANKFKKSGECIIHIGKQLHADYVLVGSIDVSKSGPRFSGGVFRVADNTQVWAKAAVNPLNDGAMAEMSKAVVAALR